METVISAFKDFINLAPRQKVNLFYALIISGLCYVIYHREKTFEANYKIWKSDYDILTTRCDTVSFYYQKKVDAIQEKRQTDLQRFNDKMENLYKANEKIKNEIE